ncbi:hypothetical protein [Pseudoduganella armeniaca]|uniref:hypothetical protein n=1 Tax=Pseudoduganella armeniaca TaxID=2072590 RepID=UPI001E3482F7|nr:hypothetical protein [Pseudoduganella armeniaca]
MRSPSSYNGFFDGNPHAPHRPFSIGLRTLLILLTGLGLLPLALLGVWSIHAAGEYQQREQERSMLDLARALSSAADAELDGVVSTLAGMARTPALAAGDVAAFYAVARLQAETQPEWLSVILTDGNGNMLFRTTALMAPPPCRSPIRPACAKRWPCATPWSATSRAVQAAAWRCPCGCRWPMPPAACTC